jgi:hypothetical protein
MATMPSAVHTPISALDIFKLLVEKGHEHLGRAHIKPLIEAFDRLLLPAVYILKEKGASPKNPQNARRPRRLTRTSPRVQEMAN